LMGLRKPLAGAENNVELSKIARTKKKKKILAVEDPRVQHYMDNIMGTSKRKQVHEQILREKEKLIPDNGHHGGLRAANPVEGPDCSGVVHVKGLAIGPNAGGEVDVFRKIHQRERVPLSSNQFFEKRF